MARRKSAFQESGLSGAGEADTLGTSKRDRPQGVRFASKDDVRMFERHDVDHLTNNDYDITKSIGGRTIRRQPSYRAQATNPLIYRVGAALLVLVGLVPLLSSVGVFRHDAALPIQGVSGGPIPDDVRARRAVNLEKRADSATSWCFKWAMQSALVNGTLYLYGGELSTENGQTQNTWNNDFISYDLTKSWQVGAPESSGLPQPDGPPAVALGYLWNDMDSLYLYGGEYSWKPPAVPESFSTWEYSIADSSWIEHSSPLTAAGNSAPDGDVSVQRAAEGAGVTVPSLGRGFYFGGHLDGYTTPGWDQSIPRVYLQSLLEYTFPGSSNSEVNSLQSSEAGSAGVYRNITDGGQQAQVGFTERADGILIYVPGFGAQGILLALAGGTNETYTQMNQINVFDIATSSWYTQATSGAYPDLRVNPCAVIAGAADGSSYNIYMFGGQHLLPYGSQQQYDDMWILTVPSFTWIKVDQSDQNVPYGRSGMTCNIWDAQMVMVGGYIGDQDLTCEYPAVYVLNLNTVKWQQSFNALTDDSDIEQNPLNQQINQKSSDNDVGGLEGSYGYEVPQVVYKVIGGNKYGGATITTPAVSPTGGPLKTGSPITYTVTEANGQVVTSTSVAGAGASGGGGPNIAAIVVGVVCGVLALVICYLLFCLFLYRKQLKLYKRHVEMAQAQARGEKPPDIPGLWMTESGNTSDQQGGSGKVFTPQYASSHAASNGLSQGGSGAQTSSTAAGGMSSERRSSEVSSTDDLLAGREPTFVGVMLNPRRSLKVINRD